jgi:Lon protease-like protein
MAFRLPLFPLSVVLFPGTSLPLHIFEPRYKRMLSDCLQADRRFGITPVERATDLPGPDSIGCIAEVRVNQELPDGRSTIVVVGASRFEVVRVLEGPEPYLVATVATFEDEPEAETDSEEIAKLRQLFERYMAGLRELHDALPEDLELPDDATSLSFHVAGEIQCDLGVKRRLLVERSTSRRIESLVLLLPLLTSAVETGLKVHRRAHSNGKGGTLPDVLAQ